MSARMLRLTDAQLELYRQRRSGVGNAELVDAKRIGAGLPEPLEREIQASVLGFLKRDSRVAFAWRANTGATRYVDSHGDARFTRFGFRGCSDILGMLRGGRMLAVECKRAREQPTDEQQAFLDAVNGAGGLGFVARGLDDVMRALAHERSPP